MKCGWSWQQSVPCLVPLAKCTTLWYALSSNNLPGLNCRMYLLVLRVKCTSPSQYLGDQVGLVLATECTMLGPYSKVYLGDQVWLVLATECTKLGPHSKVHHSLVCLEL